MLFLPLLPAQAMAMEHSTQTHTHTPQYTVICLWLKILLSFEALSGSVLKWSSLSGKNWKPFHLRGLKGSKEHQITLPVVFLLPPPPPEACNKLHLCRARPLSGWGWAGKRRGSVAALGFRLWRPCQLQNGGLLYFTPWPQAQKEPRRKNREIYDTWRPGRTPQQGNEEAANCRVS